CSVLTTSLQLNDSASILLSGASFMQKRAAALTVVLVVSTLWARQSQKTSQSDSSPRLSSAAIAAMQKIDPERIRAHVKFLASDLLEGRGTGARGGDIAAEYMAAQFALAGLKPAGDNGSYMQKVPMVGVTPAPETTFSLVSASGTP